MARKPQRAAMPKWRRAPDALIQQFGRAVEGLPGVESRKMFGYPAVFVNGNMFAGLFHDSMILRLNAEDRDTFPGAAPFEPMPGRPMREYVVAPGVGARLDDAAPHVAPASAEFCGLSSAEAQCQEGHQSCDS